MQKRYIDSFTSLLKEIDFETIENSKHSVYGIDHNFCLIYLNEAWFKFSEENNGEPIISTKFKIGTSIFDGIHGIVSEYYKDRFSFVLQNQKMWNHELQCSSPKQYREYQQTVYPLKNKKGLIIVNSLKKEYPLNDYVEINKQYEQENGFIVQCSNCRKTQRKNDHEIWDWVPLLIDKMPQNVSHSICPICFDYYYKNH